ncbi:MAG: helix-turn-helix transcriptional regulator, partial [Paraglaciecola sp.]|nr:helix-turn-helix transcriptional regulator [Paraglaciecola sp.]
SLPNVAKAIGMSASAVKKRLKKEGLTFTQIVTDVRLNVAKRLLIQPDISLTQISGMLGYSEASAFSRAFYALTQLSPREWRKQRTKNID